MKMYSLSLDERRKEITSHGTFDFPVAVYENRVGKSSLKAISWHWHEELQFCYVTEGTVSFFLNGKVFPVKKGDGIFINSEVLHTAKDADDSDGAYVCVDFHPRMIASFPNSVFERKYVSPVLKSKGMEYVLLARSKESHKEILTRLENVRRIFESKADGYEFDLCCELYMIWKNMTADFRGFYAAKGEERENDVVNRRLREMIMYIREHYQEKIRLDEIAQHLHLSPHECCRFFRKNMHCTIFDYISEYRLTRSMELLDDTSMSVTQIAYETGFGSSSYYIEKFRRKTGMTPAKYRHRNDAGH